MKTKIIAIFLVVAAVAAGWAYFRLGIDEPTGPGGSISALEQTPAAPANAVEEQVRAGTYAVSAADSRVIWEGRKTLIQDYADRGTLAVKEGVLTLDGAGAAGRIVFDMTSIKAASTGRQAGEPTLEKHLKSEDFFAVEKFPTAAFELTSAEPADAADPGRYLLRGNLTMKSLTREIEVPAGTNALKAALDNGIHIQHFCWHPDLPVDANCRTCLVEVEGREGTVTSCSLQATDGLRVLLDTPQVVRLRKQNMELLFGDYGANSPRIRHGYWSRTLEEIKRYDVSGTLYKREAPIRWKCAKCGRVHEGTEAPERCPTCAHPQGWFLPVEANY